jgi:hypothetical protein
LFTAFVFLRSLGGAASGRTPCASFQPLFVRDSGHNRAQRSSMTAKCLEKRGKTFFTAAGLS